MNGKTEMWRSESIGSPLTVKQRIFVGALLLLAFVLSFVVVRFLDPSAAVTGHVSPYGMPSNAETAPVCV
jgi:hypothetical protein